MGLFAWLFPKKKIKTPEEVFKELSLGDLVSLEYKHPNEIGMMTFESLTYTRLNKQEIENRKIRGTVSLIRKLDKPLDMLVLEVTTFESPAMPGYPRRFLFLAEEISKIRRIDNEV